MRTEELIEKLTTNLQPVPPGALLKRLLRAASIGGVIAFAIVALGYELREDLIAALGRPDFWRKLVFTLAVGLLGLAAVAQICRPGAKVVSRAVWLVAPFALIVGLALIKLAPLQPAERWATWLGQTAASCPWSILLLSIPVLIPLLHAMRQLAPTRPVIAGLFAGVASGGLAATMYGLHCPEWAVSFVATWYALGIIASGMLGAAAGSRVLRW
jgi:hypothetical protein